MQTENNRALPEKTVVTPKYDRQSVKGPGGQFSTFQIRTVQREPRASGSRSECNLQTANADNHNCKKRSPHGIFGFRVCILGLFGSAHYTLEPLSILLAPQTKLTPAPAV